MRFLILGAGALGGYFGGMLLRGGAKVDFLVRPRRAAQLAERGLVIKDPNGDLTTPVKTLAAGDIDGPYDVVLLACKTYDLDSAIAAIAPAVGAGSAILPVLNGINHIDHLVERFGAGPVLGGITVVRADLTPDGEIVRHPGTSDTAFGELTGKHSARCEAIREALAAGGVPSRISDNMMAEMWTKFCGFAASAAISTLTRAPAGEIAAAPAGARFVASVFDESARAVTAEGYPPPAVLRGLLVGLFSRAGALGPLYRPSIAEDLEAGRPTEAEQTIGDLVRRAERHGVEVPILRAALCNLQIAEQFGDRPPPPLHNPQTGRHSAEIAVATIEGGVTSRIAAGVSESEQRVTFDRISLRRLVLIRWVAIAGQAVTLLVVHYAFDFRVPLLRCFAVVGCSVALNLFVTLFRRVATRLGEREAAFFLGYDLLQLGFLLYLTGGLQNPFAILILAPVTVAATILSLRAVIGLAGFAIAIITLLALWHIPLPWRDTPLAFPPELVLGLWTALVLATVFIGGYTWSVAEEARRLRDAVAATQLALAREQRVSAVGALAAAAAHELGSPLATIAVVARELVRDLPTNSPHTEDAQLLLSQSERCRQILAELAHHPDEEGASPYTRLPISALVEAAGALYHDPRVRLIFATTGEPADAEPLVRRSPEIMHGLNNLIQNAVQFARREVSVTIHWDKTNVAVEIADDGPGFPVHLLGRLGEPYLSTRAGAANHMGLGIFIAQSLLERSGAELTFDNLVEGGAHVVISWERANVEAQARPDVAAATVGSAEIRPGNERQPA